MMKHLSLLLLPLAAIAQPDACISELAQIRRAEGLVGDTSVRRTYTLCPDTTFATGFLENGLVVNGDDPLSLRANVTVQCGDSGERDNSCIITGGIGLVGSATNLPDGAGTARIVGVTFDNLSGSVVNVRASGRIEMTDCAFLNSRSVPNIVLNTDGGSASQQVLFQDCLFKGNEAASGVGSNYTMISLPSPQTSTTFSGCEFTGNDFATFVAFEFAQTLVYSAGPLTFIDTCFVDNQVRTLGPVIVVGDVEPTVTNTGGTSIVGLFDESPECPFIAYLPDLNPGQLGPNPDCIDFSAEAVCGNLRPPTAPVMPFIGPTMAPTPAPAPAACIDDLVNIILAETAISDTSVRRTYVLCPDTTFNTVAEPSDIASQALVIRPNMSVLCGESGDRDNNCVITGGVGVSGTPSNFDDPADLGLVEIEGLTFSDLSDMVFFLGQFNGVVNVRDCAFLDSNASPNIYVESSRDDDNVFDSRRLTEGTAQRNLQQADGLDITFEDCLFSGNQINSEPTTTFAMIYLPTESTRQKTTFRRNTFLDNDFGIAAFSGNPNPPSQTLIFNGGGQLVMENNCFTNNRVLAFGVVTSLGIDNDVLSEGNFGFQSPDDCDFVSVFDIAPGEALVNPSCVDFDSGVCLANAGNTPVAPQQTPTTTAEPIMPSVAPQMAPQIAPECTEFNQLCGVHDDCCSNYCYMTVSQTANNGRCRSRTSSGNMSAMTKLSGDRGGSGGQGAM